MSIERGQLDGVPDRDGQPLEQVAPHRPLPRQRLHQPAELRPVERDQRPGDELGDPAALVGRLVSASAPSRRAAAARRSPSPGDTSVVSSGPSSPRTKWVSQSSEVGVHEHDEVAAGDEQRLPHRLALARRASRGRAGSRASGARPHRRRWRPRGSRRWSRSRSRRSRRAAATVSTSASRTRLTTSPTVAASLRAGTTRLVVRPVRSLWASRSSSVPVVPVPRGPLGWSAAAGHRDNLEG